MWIVHCQVRSEKKREQNSEYYARKKKCTGIRSMREADSGNSKAAERASNLFLEGVDIDASRESVIDHISNTFNVNMIKLS